MAIDTENQNISGSFVQTTFDTDVALLNQIEVASPEFKELLVRLYQGLNTIVISLNDKDTGYYPVNQFVTGKQYFPSIAATSLVVDQYRPVTRLVINFGALPNTGTKAVAHNININAGVTFTNIYGTASDTTGFNYIPLPYASPTLANNIELKVDATNVTVITGSNRSNFNICYIVLEFLTQ